MIETLTPYEYAGYSQQDPFHRCMKQNKTQNVGLLLLSAIRSDQMKHLTEYTLQILFHGHQKSVARIRALRGGGWVISSYRCICVYS